VVAAKQSTALGRQHAREGDEPAVQGTPRNGQDAAMIRVPDQGGDERRRPRRYEALQGGADSCHRSYGLHRHGAEVGCGQGKGRHGHALQRHEGPHAVPAERRHDQMQPGYTDEDEERAVGDEPHTQPLDETRVAISGDTHENRAQREHDRHEARTSEDVGEYLLHHRDIGDERPE